MAKKYIWIPQAGDLIRLVSDTIANKEQIDLLK